MLPTLNLTYLLTAIIILATAPARSDESTCTNWLSEDFWVTAEPSDISACLDGGRRLEQRNVYGATPLHLASANSNRADILLALLIAGANVNLTNIKGYTPLHVAAERSEIPAIVAYLLVWGSDVNDRLPSPGRGVCISYSRITKNCATTPLHMLSARGSTKDILEIMLAAGADVNVLDEDERTPLHRAAATGDVEAVRTLLQSGANAEATDAQGETPLHTAAKRLNGSVDILKTLLAAGATPDTQRDDGVTPVIHAAYYAQDPEAFKILLNKTDKHCFEAGPDKVSILTGLEYNKGLTKDDDPQVKQELGYWKIHEKCSKND